VAQHEAELWRRREPWVGDARVVERPLHEFFDEVVPERRKRRALGAGQHHHDSRAVLEAVVEQISCERVVFGVRPELTHVFGGPERAHARAGPFLELMHQLARNGGFEQLLLARKIFVEVADRRARARRHLGHGGRLEAELCKRFGGGSRKGFAHVLFRDLNHAKENYEFSFMVWQVLVGPPAKRGK
jgi:hypothetical protein